VPLISHAQNISRGDHRLHSFLKSTTGFYTLGRERPCTRCAAIN
jgi:hypothetical protein